MQPMVNSSAGRSILLLKTWGIYVVLFLFVHHITNSITIMQLSPMEMEQMVR
jgi:hypothetical protein